MVESGYIIEYCGTPYVHGLAVLCMCLISAWIPVLGKGALYLLNNILRLANKLLRRWF